MDSPDFLNSRLQTQGFMVTNQLFQTLLLAKEESRCPLCNGLCHELFFNRALSVPVDHGLINYIDTTAKCRHLQNLPVKGLCGTCSSA
jgi:hypothetical protein